MLEPQEGMSTDEILDFAKYAEGSGYGYLFRSDHLLSTSGRRGLDSSECWITLGIIASRTIRLKFGPMVSPIGFRNPALLARMACTIDSFSHGRLILSLGAGWYKEEYEAHGIEFPKFQTRKEQLHEALKIIRDLTCGKRVDFEGEYFKTHLECFPKPKNKIHLVIGGKDEKIVETIGEFADEWNIFSPTVEEISKFKSLLTRKNPKGREIDISEMGTFFIGETKQDLNSHIQRYAKTRGLSENAESLLSRIKNQGIPCGLVDEFASQINVRMEAGIEKFYFQILDTGNREMLDVLTETLKTKF